MKIAYICQSYPPMISGASIVVARLVNGMAERGHQVLVIAASDRGEAYIEQFPSVRVVRLASVTNPKRAYQRFVRGSFKKIYATLTEFAPDLIHIHDVISLGIAGLITGHLMNIPVTATIHQLPWFVSAYLPEIPGLKTSVESCLWQYSRWLNQQCQTMIVPTATISRTIAQNAGFRTIAISNGVDLQRFHPLPPNREDFAALYKKYHLDPELPIILHVGRLDADKRVDVAIKAAAQAMQKVPAQLLVAGDGECRESLMLLATRLGMTDHAHFPGFVDAAIDLPVLYQMAAVFVTASEIETQGLVLLEAMASGLPVVAVDATCIHEVVKHQLNGYLLPPGDLPGISNGLVDILSDPVKAQQMGEVGRAIVQDHSIHATLNQHETLYHKVIRRYQQDRKSASLQNRIRAFVDSMKVV